MNLSRRSIELLRDIGKITFFLTFDVNTNIPNVKQIEKSKSLTVEYKKSDNISIIQRDDAVIYVSDTIRPNSAKENAKYRMNNRVRSNLKGKTRDRCTVFLLLGAFGVDATEFD